MTSRTDAPPPALGELARRAEIVKQCIAAEEGYWRRSHDFTSVEAHALAQATASAKAMLASMCSADSILQLVALASGGAADTARLDVLEAEALKDAMTLHDGLLPLRTKMQTRGLGFGPALERSLREAIDTFRAARSLTPERPADV